MKTATGRPLFIRKHFNYSIILAIFFLAIAALAVPVYSGKTNFVVAPATSSDTVLQTAQPRAASYLWRSKFRPIVPSLPTSETIATFASDCTTPQTSFSLGETVCAKTDNVDLNWPGGRWVDWILTGNTNTIVSGSRTTTLITSNPQTFTYAPTTAGVYKVEITQDDGNGGDNPQTPAVFTVTAPPPDTAVIYRADCVTPASSFNLGATVCAKITGAPLDSRPQRRLSIESPAGYIAAEVEVTSDPQTLTFTLPTSATSVYGNATVDNRGGWQVTNSSGIDGSQLDSSLFFVHDPTTPVSDLVITKTISGSNQIPAGANVNYTVILKNYGPDAAATVQITDDVPANTNFVAVIQGSGPTFTCVNPTPGATTGTSTCTIASFATGDTAEFTFVYDVNAGAAVGTKISNTADVSST